MSLGDDQVPASIIVIIMVVVVCTVIVAVTLVAVALHPKYMLLALCAGYVLSAPVLYLRDRRALRSTSGAEVADEPAPH